VTNAVRLLISLPPPIGVFGNETGPSLFFVSYSHFLGCEEQGITCQACKAQQQHDTRTTEDD
jgi:hypothetical protein